MQRYKCNFCKYRFQHKRQNKKQSENIWKDYTHSKQTLGEIGKKYNKSHVWVREQLDKYEVNIIEDIEPQPTIVVPDTTFWGRTYGVTVFRSWNLKRNIWWQEVPSEKQIHYFYGRKILEDKGWQFTAAVIDGKRGLATVFKDIPVQVCHFHQIKTVTKYLTRRPKTEAGQELRQLALTLTNTTEEEFTSKLKRWEKRWHSFIKERTYIAGINRWHYTHKNVRSAFLSLKRNLPYLFTYLKHPELNIPNTTNTIDGSFASVKQKVGARHGLRKDRHYKIICDLLRRG